MDGWVDGGVDGWVGRWMDGWRKGWREGWMEGWAGRTSGRSTVDRFTEEPGCVSLKTVLLCKWLLPWWSNPVSSFLMLNQEVKDANMWEMWLLGV